MNDRELYAYHDVYGHLPAKYNRPITIHTDVPEGVRRVHERLRERFRLTNTLQKGEVKPIKEVSKTMKTMIVILYLLSISGIIIQVGEIIPGLPDIWAGGLTLGLLIIANAVLWRQLVKNSTAYAARLAQMQQEHREEVMANQQHMLKLAESNKEEIKTIMNHLKDWKEK